MRTVRIAVSGVAGASGYGILKCADLINNDSNSNYRVETYPLDVKNESVGLFMGTQPGSVLPKPEWDIQAWVDFVEKHKIDLLIPGADRDLLPFAQNRESLRAVVSDPRVIEIADDKLKTALYLNDELNLNVPDFTHPENANDWNIFPCVVKPRVDAASRGFRICQDREEMNFYLKHTKDPIIQEYVRGDEYTCNVFCDRDGIPKAKLVMLRKDYSGIAIQARPVVRETIDEMMDVIGRDLKPMGTLSVQLKMPFDTPYPFEINARMSGSSIVRALAGYNDLDLMIRHYLFGEDIVQPEIDYSQTYFRWYSTLSVNTSLLHRLAEKEVEIWN